MSQNLKSDLVVLKMKLATLESHTDLFTQANCTNCNPNTCVFRNKANGICRANRYQDKLVELQNQIDEIEKVINESELLK